MKPEIFWADLRVCVTGGSGFLGSYVVKELQRRGVKDVFIPRKQDYNLVHNEAVKQLLHDAQPDLIIHLAASVGGIGANLQHQAEYFYDNLMMGVQLLHEAYCYGVEKFVAIGTICSYPKLAPIPFREDDLWNGYPEETNAPYGLAKKMMLVQSQVYRSQYEYNSIYLLPVNLYGPGDNFDPVT
ncbi:MAG: NAD-dependent epimerase/dehydratase family protein, partial [Anaerolineales bacterium]|nr:NAD-dependent epimerase/dehydratase family protein [Anaerolineales bacterium]